MFPKSTHIKSEQDEFLSSFPIDTIQYSQCMGFKIGDSIPLVVSMISHLKLMNEMEKSAMNLFLCSNPSIGFICTSSGLFPNIDNIGFHFSDDALVSVLIRFKPEQFNFNFLFVLLKKMLLEKIGKPYFVNSTVVHWRKQDAVINLVNEDSELFVAVTKTNKKQ